MRAVQGKRKKFPPGRVWKTGKSVSLSVCELETEPDTDSETRSFARSGAQDTLPKCLALASPPSLLISSVLIPACLRLAVVLDHQCEPSFLSVPLDSAHLYRSNAPLVLIRPE